MRKSMPQLLCAVWNIYVVRSKCSIIHSRFQTLTGMIQPGSAKRRGILSAQPSIGHDVYPPSLAQSCKNRQVYKFCEKSAPSAQLRCQFSRGDKISRESHRGLHRRNSSSFTPSETLNLNFARTRLLGYLLDLQACGMTHRTVA
jgi:hypothetical protein